MVWSSSSGAYAGITLNGSIIKPSPASNRDYYGRDVTTRQIIDGDVAANPGTQALRTALG